MSAPFRNRGASFATVLIAVAATCVVAASFYPAWTARSFRAHVDRVAADVDALTAAARAFRGENGRWPTPAAPGEAPPELSGLGGEQGIFGRVRWSLGWTVWDVVDSIPAPAPADLAASDDAPQMTGSPRMLPVVRDVAAVAVHSGDAELLAALVSRYEEEAPFVLDSLWLLVLPERVDESLGR